MKQISLFIHLLVFIFTFIQNAPAGIFSRIDLINKKTIVNNPWFQLDFDSPLLPHEYQQTYLKLKEEYPDICALVDEIAFSPFFDNLQISDLLDKLREKSIISLLELLSITHKELLSFQKKFILDYCNESNEKSYNFLQKLNEAYFLFAASFLRHLHDHEDLSDFTELTDLLMHSTLEPMAALLTPPLSINKRPFDIYNDIAQKIKNLKIDKNDHFPLFGHISALLLRYYLLTCSFIKNYDDLPIVNALLQELSSATSEKRCTYRWFLYFNKRILMVESIHSTPRTYFFVTNFDSFIEDAMRSLDISTISDQQKFEHFLDHLGNDNYKNRLSVKALSNLFPHIIMLHFPFDLTAEDLLKASTFVECDFWPLGFAFHKTTADGDTSMPPYIFEEHDIQHFGVLLNNNTITFHQKEMMPEDSFKRKEYLWGLKQLVFFRITTFNQLKKIIFSIIQNEQDSLKKHIFIFFAFYIFHETRDSIRERLYRLTNSNVFINDVINDLLYNPSYYLPLLPKTIQECVDRALNNQIIKKHIEEFITLIHAHMPESFPSDWGKSKNYFSLLSPSVEKQENSYEVSIYFDPCTYSAYYAAESIRSNPYQYCRIFHYEMNPYKTPSIGSTYYQNLQALKALNIDITIPFEETSFVRYVFNSILPNGKAIHLKNHTWIEFLNVKSQH